jgi:predicted nucleic acid-binding protein
MGSRLRYVVDANIWIDLDEGSLLASVFRLCFDWLAPDVIVRELSTTVRRELSACGLQEIELSPEQILEVARVAALYPALSDPDLFALALARSLKVGLLTGDRRLRDAADREGIAVHGLLWLLDQLVNRQITSPLEAAAALERMISRGARLPEVEVEQRLHRWRHTAC